MAVRERGPRAMTLVELMVSLALGVILIGIMVFVWTTSQKIVSQTTDKIGIYQNLRNILDIIERDVANVVRTTDMEFFRDVNGNQHYDESNSAPEEFIDAQFRGDEEFFVDSNSANPIIDPNLADGSARDLNNVPYFFAPLIYRPTSYEPVEGFDGPTIDSHRRDEFYFRSFALIEGESRPVMVHYRLRIPDAYPQRPTLLRRVFWVDRSVDTPDIRQRTDELADGVTDLEFAMFYKESRIFDRGQFLDAAQARNVPSGESPVIPGLHAQYNARAISLIYKGDAIVERTRSNGIWLRPVDASIQFGAVRPGDRIYLYDAQDDDNVNGTTDLGALFGQRFLTVEQIIAFQNESQVLGSRQSKIFIKFVEPLDFSLLADGLGGEPSQQDVPIPDTGKTRTIFQSFRCKFRVGFLPGAFRVRFKYRDFRNRRLVPFERVIRVLNS